MTTDELAEKLKSFVFYENETYFLKMRKHSTKKRWNVEYVSNDGKSLCNTWRSGKTLNEAMQSMYDFIQTIDTTPPDNIFQFMIDSAK